jgi:hypothetical protein
VRRTDRDPAAPRMTRRCLLQAGGLGMLGLSLPELLWATERRAPESPVRGQADSCIFIVQYGGASQIDTFDPKPAAPAEVRGPYRSIPTSVPGIQVSEMLPRLARLAEHFCLVRSLEHRVSDHDGGMHVCMTGDLKPLASTPYVGSLVAKLRPATHNMPSYVWLQNLAGDVQPRFRGGGFLGADCSPLVVGEDEDNTASPNYQFRGFNLPADVSSRRLQQRLSLLDSLELCHAEPADAGPRDLQRFRELAVDLVSGPRARQAFDLRQEPSAGRDRYGRHALGQNLLLARRLVEAGVRLVTVNAWCGRASKDDVLATQGWDHHGAAIQRCGIFDSGTFGLGFVLPRFDAALSALLEDLHVRGLLQRTLVVVVGEFGRTPRIASNPYAGRDHWPQCYSALLAGGGMRGGAVHGASDRLGAYPAKHPVSPEALGATIFHMLGIPPETRLGPDGFSFRVSNGGPIEALFA